MKLFLATNNNHKINEIKSVINKLTNKNIEFIYPSLLGIQLAPEETGNTLEENAFIKASAFYTATNIPTLADDSGLEIEALDGLPGVNSARFAEPHNDAANRKKVLKLMKDKENKNARFRTTLAYYDGKEKYYFNGICSGVLIDEERGTNGFGYDPIFIPTGYNKTFAEMDAHEKNSLSHRYLAVVEFCKWFKSMLC
jgi:XTP/dITP diphosphohydrolase